MIPSPLSLWLWWIESWTQLFPKNESTHRQMAHNALLITDAWRRHQQMFSF